MGGARVEIRSVLAFESCVRDLYRRLDGNPLQSVLEPWYKVAATALVDLSGVWSALQDLLTTAEQSAALSPPLVTTYVHEISHAFRLECLQGWLYRVGVIPSYYVTALGFSSMDELTAFCQQAAALRQATSVSKNNHTRVVSFLESRMTVTSPLVSSSTAASAQSAG